MKQALRRKMFTLKYVENAILSIQESRNYSTKADEWKNSRRNLVYRTKYKKKGCVKRIAFFCLGISLAKPQSDTLFEGEANRGFAGGAELTLIKRYTRQ